MGIPIVLATPDRLQDLASLCGQAFVVEPAMLWSSGDHGNIADRFTRQYAWYMERPLAQGMVWETAKPGGAVIWIPPTGTEDWEQSLLEDQRVAAVVADMDRYARFWEWISEHEPTEPVWHLDTVAVAPSLRGQGVGAALIDHGLAFAQRDGLPAVLETGNPSNVPIYESRGFRVVEALEAPDGGPIMWFMRRDPG